MVCVRCKTEEDVPLGITPEQYDELAHDFAMVHTDCTRWLHPDNTWAVFDLEGNQLLCKKCGATQPRPELPMDLMKFVGFLREFTDAHAHTGVT